METLTPQSVDASDVRAVLRAALSNGHAPDLTILHAAPREELAQALADLSPTELGRLVTRLGDEALADIVAELDAFDAARPVAAPAAEALTLFESARNLHVDRLDRAQHGNPLIGVRPRA